MNHNTKYFSKDEINDINELRNIINKHLQKYTDLSMTDKQFSKIHTWWNELETDGQIFFRNSPKVFIIEGMNRKRPYVARFSGIHIKKF